MTMFKVLSVEETSKAEKVYLPPTREQWAVKQDHNYWRMQRVKKAQLKDAVRQFNEMLDGIENPYPEWESLACQYHPKEWFIFNKAIQVIKQSLQEQTLCQGER